MLKSIKNSFSTRAWLTVIVIASLAILATASSGILSWASEDDAEAINIAGSLRMATFRINHQLATDFRQLQLTDNALLLSKTLPKEKTNNNKLIQTTIETNKTANIDILITDMEQRIGKLINYQNKKANHTDNKQSQQIQISLNNINQQWQNVLKPLLITEDKSAFYQSSANFLIEVDNFVTRLQYRNEQRQRYLQLVQLTALFVTIIIMLVGMYELKQKVLDPLDRLINANTHFTKGELNTRINISGYDEINLLAKAFNDMASTIESNQQSLEAEVKDKTQNLRQSNQALFLLYEFAQQMTTSEVTLDKIGTLIKNYGDLLPNYQLVLCLQNENYDTNSYKDKISIHQNGMQEICSSQDCTICPITHDNKTRVYPLKHQNTSYGEILVQELSTMEIQQLKQQSRAIDITVNNSMLKEQDMLNTLVHLISTALSLKEQRQQQEQLILLEERTTIARELHDSLAQSLSYLKIQVSVLERLLTTDNKTDYQIKQIDETKVAKVIKHIKTGLDSAYLQLRELLVTFRLHLDSENFDKSLLSAIEEFSQKGNFSTQFNNRVISENFNAHEQVNILHILRESLSNVHRHAHASEVCIDLNYNEDSHQVILQIADNGIGLNNDFDEKEHHGLIILQERAKQLNGKIKFLANDPSGTIVQVSFLPRFFIRTH